jgi:hypothetical protein
MAVLQASAILFGRGNLYSGLVAGTPDPDVWFDTHGSWGGTVGPSAPPFVSGNDDIDDIIPPLISYPSVSGVSASPPWNSPPPVGDPNVLALQAALVKTQGVK